VAKSTKDLTSWSGGVSNATEASDMSDDGGSFAIKNLDGTTKIGVLKPAGTMKISQLLGSDSEKIDLSKTKIGQGLSIMPTDFDLGGTIVYESTSGTDFNGDGIVNTVTLHTGAASNGEVGAFTLADDGKLIWTAQTSEQIHVSLAFDGASGPEFTGGQWYAVQADITYSFGYESALVWCQMHEDTYGGTANNTSHCWSDFGISSSPLTTSVTQKAIFRATGSGDNKIFEISFMTSTGSNGQSVTIENIIFYKLAAPSSHELQFLQSVDSNTNSRINVYQDGADAAETTGSIYKYISLGPIDSGSTPDVDYLKSANALRISDANFDNDYNTKFFGLINREFFKGVTTGFNSYSTLGVDTIARHRGIKSKYWIEEDSTLIKPNPLNCTMPCMGDMIAFAANGGTADDEMFWHNDLSYVAENVGDKYLLRLEYAVVKNSWLTQTGNWNPAEDGQDGTNVLNEEKTVKYHFYCSFVYDRGSQESELTQIDQVMQQGDMWDGNTYHGDSYRLPTSWSSEIGLYFHDADYAARTSIISDGITSIVTGSTITVTDSDHGLVNSDVVIISETTNYNGSFTVSSVTTDTFDLNAAYVSDETSGTWTKITGVNYTKEPAWDCDLKFRASIMVSPSGASDWNLPERCTGVNWYYSTSTDAHNKKYRLVETDFVDGLKYKSSDTADWSIWKSFIPTSAVSVGTGLSTESTSDVRWFYSSNDTPTDGMVTINDPPEGEHWDSLYGMKSSSWPDIKYKTSCIIGGQAFYGHVKVDTEVHKDRVLVSMANHGYDMIPHDNFLDVVAGDGDEIVKLLPYSNQLYVFKKNKVVVCDVGGEEDKVASEHLVGGIENPDQACITSKGVFWINKHGAFLSSGGEAESLVLGNLTVEQRGEDIEYSLDFTANDETVTHAGTEVFVPGTEIVSTYIGGRVGIVSSVTSTTEFELVDKAITTNTDAVALVREGPTDCFWSLRDEDVPVVGYNPREEQVFVLSATVADVRKHFWKYDLKDESWWYHDGHHTTQATGGDCSSSSATITHASNAEIERGMFVYIDGSDGLGLNFVDSTTGTSTTLTTAANVTATIADSSATFIFVGGSFRALDSHTNFALDKQNRLAILGGDNDDTVLKAKFKHWNKDAAIQNIFYDTGMLDLGSPSTWKQLYKISIVAKNSTNKIFAICQGISPEQADADAQSFQQPITVGGVDYYLSDMDLPGLFGVENAGGMNTTKQFRATHHNVLGRPSAGIPLPPLAKIAAKSLFFKVMILNQAGFPAPKDFELHSITFVYRDRGVKG
jgi:hypothetical protein